MEPGHYHLHLHPISRRKGHSIHAAIAYRHGTRELTASAAAAYRHAQEHGDGLDAYDYRHKIGVQWFGIVAPDHAPAWCRDPKAVWAAVDRTERRINARLAQEIIIALPHQVDVDEHIVMLRHFATTYCVDRYGMIADIAIHAPPVHHGGDPRNFHAHVLLTDRPITPDGFAKTKDRRYQDKGLVDEFRAGWTLTHNQHMERLGLPHRIDHRTLAAQREDALARGDEENAILLARLPQIHLGKAAHGSHPEASIFADRLARNHRILKANTGTRERHQAHVQQRYHQAAHDALAEDARIHATEPPQRSLHELRRIYGRLPALQAMMQADTTTLAEIAAKANGWTADTPPAPSILQSFLGAWEPTPAPRKPWFTVTARDLTFIFYNMGLIPRANLQQSLERATEADVKRDPRQAAFFPTPPPRQPRPHNALKQRLEARLGHIQAAVALHHGRELAFERRYIQRTEAMRQRPEDRQRQADARAKDRSRARFRTPPPDAPS